MGPMKAVDHKNVGERRDRGNGGVAGLSQGSLTLGSLARVPELVHDPKSNLFEIISAYQGVRIECDEARRQLINVSALTDSENRGPGSLAPMVRVLALIQTSYGLLLTLAITFNAVLRAFSPSDRSLIEESEYFCDEVSELVKQASQYRPLGSSYMPLCIATAWAVTENTPKRNRLEETLLEYQSDFAVASWLDIAMYLRNRFEHLHLVLSSGDLKSLQGSSGKAEIVMNDCFKETGSEGCCIQ